MGFRERLHPVCALMHFAPRVSGPFFKEEHSCVLGGCFKKTRRFRAFLTSLNSGGIVDPWSGAHFRAPFSVDVVFSGVNLRTIPEYPPGVLRMFFTASDFPRPVLRGFSRRGRISRGARNSGWCLTPLISRVPSKGWNSAVRDFGPRFGPVCRDAPRIQGQNPFQTVSSWGFGFSGEPCSRRAPFSGFKSWIRPNRSQGSLTL